MNRNIGIRYFSIFIILLTVILVFSITVTKPHDENGKKGTIPDEYAFYSWSKVYMSGRTHVPISELTTDARGTFVTMPFTHPLDVEWDLIENGNDGRLNDILVKVRFENGTSAPFASVMITGSEMVHVTDGSGEAIIDDYEYPVANIIVRLEQDGVDYLSSVIFSKVITSQMNYDTYIDYEMETISVSLFDNSTPKKVEIELPDGLRSPPPDVRFSLFINEKMVGNYPVGDQKTILIEENPPFNVSVIDNRGDPLRDGKVRIDDTVITLDEKGTGTFMGSGRFRVIFSVRDIFDDPVKGANITVDGEEKGLTDDQGSFSMEEDLSFGSHNVIAHKDGIEVRDLISVVAYKDGDAVLVNRWAPGQSILIGIFSIFGMEWAISLFMLLLGAWAVFRIGEIFHSTLSGLISSILFTTAGGTVMMSYSRYMGDLSTTVLAIFGFYLFLESIRLIRSGIWKWGSFISLIGGLFMGFSVVTRYSTGVALIGPATATVVLLAGTISFKGKKIDRKQLMGFLKVAIPFGVGALLILLPLFTYNEEYFGGPFNSGHQMSNMITVTTGMADENSSSSSEPSESFLGSYLEFTHEDFENIPRLFSLLMYIHTPLLMALFAVPFALLLKGKRYISLALLAWILAVMLIYISQGWAGSWVNSDVRSMEDMRYYLPALAPATILVGGLMAEIFRRGPSIELKQIKRKAPVMGVISIIVVLLLVMTGIGTGLYAIDQQLDRLKVDDNKDMGDYQNLPPDGQPPPGNDVIVIKDVEQQREPPDGKASPGSDMEMGNQIFSPEELNWTIPLILISFLYSLILGIWVVIPRKNNSSKFEE